MSSFELPCSLNANGGGNVGSKNQCIQDFNNAAPGRQEHTATVMVAIGVGGRWCNPVICSVGPAAMLIRGGLAMALSAFFGILADDGTFWRLLP
jgi:hypothetical protein